MNITPQITDAKSIQDLSKILAFPMVAVAYFLQTGPTISWSGNVFISMGPELPAEIQLRRLFFIFALKSLWSGTIGGFAYAVLATGHIKSNGWLLPLIAAMLFALALFGLFGTSRFPQLRLIDSFWFYAAMVWGFFFTTMTEQLKTGAMTRRVHRQS